MQIHACFSTTNDEDTADGGEFAEYPSAGLSISVSKCLNADVGDATPLEGNEKLPNVMSLQLLSIQEPSYEQDARNDVFPRRPEERQSDQPILLS